MVLRRCQVAAIAETWGKQCDGFMALSNVTRFENNEFNITRLGRESFRNIWQKVKAAVLLVDAHLTHHFDWMLVAGDDTYVSVPALRAYLSSEQVQVQVHEELGAFIGQVMGTFV